MASPHRVTFLNICGIACSGHSGCGYEAVGEAAEGRDHHHSFLIEILNNLFYVGQTLCSAYRSPAEFQYNHSYDAESIKKFQCKLPIRP